jgi:hypothetical protein
MSWQICDQWAAGFFDGEGSISVVRRKRGGFIEHHLSVQVGQNDQRPLIAMRDEYGGSQCNSKTPSGCWRWRIHGVPAGEFLKRIRPYSIVKAEQIDLALELRALVGKPGSRVPQEVWEKKEEIWKRLMAVKGREV